MIKDFVKIFIRAVPYLSIGAALIWISLFLFALIGC
jgi:hypothetical protein